MRQVRFVALSEDGQAMVLADEVGHLLSLPIDERVSALLRPDRPAPRVAPVTEEAQLAPRDIQARIRAGESADEVAQIAGVPVDRVLRFAGPVLQERAMLAAQARRTKLRNSGVTLAEVVDARLGQLGVEHDAIVWDAHRREDGTWLVVASWPSGRAHACATWELDKARLAVTPHDDMAQYLCASPADSPARGGHEIATPRTDPGTPAPTLAGRESRSTRDPIRRGRDALVATLDRPLDPPATTATIEGTDAEETPTPIPAVPSLAVLRPRRTTRDTPPASPDRPAKRGPAWDDVLFGPAPAKQA